MFVLSSRMMVDEKRSDTYLCQDSYNLAPHLGQNLVPGTTSALHDGHRQTILFPHFGQNFTPSGTGALHDGQILRRACPHLTQNFVPAETTEPHFGHFDSGCDDGGGIWRLFSLVSVGASFCCSLANACSRANACSLSSACFFASVSFSLETAGSFSSMETELTAKETM